MEGAADNIEGNPSCPVELPAINETEVYKELERILVDDASSSLSLEEHSEPIVT